MGAKNNIRASIRHISLCTAEALVTSLLLDTVSLLFGVDASYCHRELPNGELELIILDLPEWLCGCAGLSPYFLYPFAMLCMVHHRLRIVSRLAFTADALLQLATTFVALFTWKTDMLEWTSTFAVLAADATLRAFCHWKYGTCFYSTVLRRLRGASLACMGTAVALVATAVVYNIVTCPIL